ncbi:DUF423 domain-containing protein [Bacteroidia bacterium]|jgi:uncharacterized membrane protein YgdD (TMEM256/DUF423 family)|nr:DUF423 domain-containing protein [Bacteroidia bacterium]
MQKRLAGWACLAIGIGIIVGAFGAHKMQEILTEKQLVTFSTAVRYWFYNSIGLLGLSALSHIKLSMSSVITIAIGTFIFCFSLWLNAILGIKVFGMIAPVGGLTMVTGWFLASYGILKSK